MNDLEANRIRRIENQVIVLVGQLALTNTNLAEVIDDIEQCYEENSPRAVELRRKAKSLRDRVAALRTLIPNSR